MTGDRPEIVLTDAPKPKNGACPGCGADKKHRVASGGFGQVHPVCNRCGYEFIGETWHG